jgi:uncharacterized damage-inducible protein DinB
MNWTETLKNLIEGSYGATEKLMGKMDPDSLDWKPESGSNWMTVGQLLKHLTESCGMPIRGFVTGDWGMPEGVKMDDVPPEEMLPPAEKMPAVGSVDEARKLLAEDKALALKMIDQAGEDDLNNKIMPVPWAPAVQYPLGRHLLSMIWHLDSHKAQLFFYLKQQGKPVNTGDLWGM